MVAQLTPEKMHHLFLLRGWRLENKWGSPAGAHGAENCEGPATWFIAYGIACAETKCLESDALGCAAWTRIAWWLEKGVAWG